MALRLAAPPRAGLYRIGRWPDSLAWPDPDYRGEGRFDDPPNAFGVLEAAVERRTCFFETLDTYRPDRALLQRLALFGTEGFTPRSGLVPDSFFAKLIVRFRLDPGQTWLGLRSEAPETAVALSREPAIARLLPELGYGHRFKPGDLVGSDRRLTQTIAGRAYETGFNRLASSSRHDRRRDCWAVFESAARAAIADPFPIAPDDPDLIAVAREFELTISFARPS